MGTLGPKSRLGGASLFALRARADRGCGGHFADNRGPKLLLEHPPDAQCAALRELLGALGVEHLAEGLLGVRGLARQRAGRRALAHLLEEHVDEERLHLLGRLVQLHERGLLLGRERPGLRRSVDAIHQMISTSACSEPDSRSAWMIAMRSRGETPIVFSARTTCARVAAPEM